MYETNTPYCKAMIQKVAGDPDDENSEDVYFVTAVRVKTSKGFERAKFDDIYYYSKKDVSSAIAKATSDVSREKAI